VVVYKKWGSMAKGMETRAGGGNGVRKSITRRQANGMRCERPARNGTVPNQKKYRRGVQHTVWKSRPVRCMAVRNATVKQQKPSQPR